MTKVEELRQECINYISLIASAGITNKLAATLHLDSLISAARSEGVAEGAEQEAAKIVHCYECVGGDENTPEKDQCMLWGEGKDCYCSRGKRVLAPTKESEK